MTNVSVPTSNITESNDVEATVAALIASYVDDPFMRWLFPDTQQYLRNFPSFVLTFGGKAFVRQSAYLAGQNCAAALLLPPRVRPDPYVVAEFIAWTLPKSQHEAFSEFANRGACYEPTEPHWRLALMGVDPNYRRHHIGITLLKRSLLACDAAHLPVYLEASPISVPFYQKEGFDILGEIRSGAIPPLVPMLRTAR
jgi:GNAT superfamily N-acetyltransferase